MIDSMSRRVAVARFGEALAERFLAARGAVVLGRNVRVGSGEIDLHVLLEGTSTAVEVRTRLAEDRDAALRQFSREKADTVRRYAVGLSPAAFRVDLVAVLLRRGWAELHWVPFAG